MQQIVDFILEVDRLKGVMRKTRQYLEARLEEVRRNGWFGATPSPSAPRS